MSEQRTRQPRRILILGGPGSGKTTLGAQIASGLGAPLFELDRVGYEGGAGAKRPLRTKLDEVRTIATADTWVAEGIFLWWTDALAEHADVIVWLDIPWRVAWWRIVSRHVRTSLAGTNQHRGLRKLRYFLRNAHAYYHGEGREPQALDDDAAVSRARTREWLRPYGDKVVRCAASDDVTTLRHSLRDRDRLAMQSSRDSTHL